MLYILLIIIAIGVLLASEGGRTLLGFLVALLVIGGVLYVGFWVIVLAVGLLSDENFKQTALDPLGTIMLAGFAIFITYKVYKGFKNGGYIKNIKNWFYENTRSWVDKVTMGLLIFMAFVLLSVSIFAIFDYA